MRFYITSVTIQKGEREYGEQFVVKARNGSDARRKTEQWILEWNSYEWMDYKWKKDQLDLFDEIIAFDCAREIPSGDYLVLQKYLPIVG